MIKLRLLTTNQINFEQSKEMLIIKQEMVFILTFMCHSVLEHVTTTYYIFEVERQH